MDQTFKVSSKEKALTRAVESKKVVGRD